MRDLRIFLYVLNRKQQYVNCFVSFLLFLYAARLERPATQSGSLPASKWPDIGWAIQALVVFVTYYNNIHWTIIQKRINNNNEKTKWTIIIIIVVFWVGLRFFIIIIFVNAETYYVLLSEKTKIYSKHTSESFFFSHICLLNI